MEVLCRLFVPHAPEAPTEVVRKEDLASVPGGAIWDDGATIWDGGATNWD
jgi:hypothetical protein